MFVAAAVSHEVIVGCFWAKAAAANILRVWWPWAFTRSKSKSACSSSTSAAAAAALSLEETLLYFSSTEKEIYGSDCANPAASGA